MCLGVEPNAGVQSAKLKFQKIGCERCLREMWILNHALRLENMVLGLIVLAVTLPWSTSAQIEFSRCLCRKVAATNISGTAFRSPLVAVNGIIELSLISQRSITSSTFLQLCSQCQQFFCTHSPKCLELCLELLCPFQW